jgi:hypothetical protein
VEPEIGIGPKPFHRKSCFKFKTSVGQPDGYPTSLVCLKFNPSVNPMNPVKMAGF